MGDLLFAVTNLARHLNVNPEIALRKANNKFKSRFTKMETELQSKGKSLEETSLDEMEATWQQVKQST